MYSLLTIKKKNMLEVYSILCMYCTTSIQLIKNIIDLIPKLVCITDLIKIDKSDKGEYSLCTLQMSYTSQIFCS